MWEYEHSVETDVAAAALWARWADVATWAAWNGDIEKVELSGPFAVGSTITMTPRGDEPVVLKLAEVRENETFIDEAEFGGVIIRTLHRLDSLGAGRTRITYRTEITGPAAQELGPQIGPAITADFPETIAALVRAAGAGVEAQEQEDQEQEVQEDQEHEQEQQQQSATVAAAAKRASRDGVEAAS